MDEATIREAMRVAGRRGGSTTRERHGADHFRKIGAKGGLKTRDTHGSEFFKANGKKGGARMAELIAAGKAALEGSNG